MITVTLTEAEMIAAGICGVRRNAHALSYNAPTTLGDQPPSWQLHCEGACAELAVARALGIPFDATVNTYKAADLGARIQVRSSPNELRSEMPIRDRDNKSHAYVWVTGIAPVFHIWGWIEGADAVRDEWRRDVGGEGRPAWFVPRSALADIATLSADGSPF